MQFEHISNFRDLGGIQTQDGKKIKNRRLLRSGQLFNLNQKEIEELVKNYDLHNIVDMRTSSEISSQPDTKIPGTNYFNLDFFGGSSLVEGEEAPSEKSMEEHMLSTDADEYLIDTYIRIITEKQSQQALKKFFDIVRDNEEGSTLWHCFAGKDRTGISAALLLASMGVSKEAIYQDYLRTNELRKPYNDALIEEVRKKGAPEKALENLRTMMEVKASYLDAAYDTIEERYGSVDNYIKEILQVTDEDIAIIKKKYLV